MEMGETVQVELITGISSPHVWQRVVVVFCRQVEEDDRNI